MTTGKPGIEVEPPQGSAKDLAIVFTDIVGSTAMIVKAGDLAFHKAIEAIFTITQESVKVHQGRIMKYFGDGCMVIFEDAGSALAFATKIQRRLSESPIVVAGEPLRVRIGLHVGRVYVKPTSYGEDAFGDPINLAARLTALAKPGQVVLSGAACAALPDERQRFLGTPERVAVNGFCEPVEMIRVDL